ncbi:DDRGK domain protein [Perilla frutescens var. hirtella]|uniref:DDRGK domain-containing protein 1 n=1 Tax=Perilla frutescens var. hirtella TaxID=608512 RepID=A0AAD4JJ86_PERFH|nr:DDRGK domain protein [Perilla frutescens var. hirtella]
MEDMIVAIVMMIVVFSLIPLYLWRRRLDSRPPHQHEEEPQDVQGERVVRAGNNRRMRRRPAASSSASTSSAAANVEETVDGSDDEDAGDGNYRVKASKKKEKKRHERDAQRQAEDAARESRSTKQDRYDEMRRRKDEEREAHERMLFEKWKGAFSVDAEGTTENDVQDGSQGLLFDFVEYIKKHKYVPLEDIAAEFKLRTQDCINRINSLETMGRLSGVMDDRGKYIYISLEEMKAVADYIRREGRVSISHLASKSNQFIDLEPKSHAEDIQSVEEITFA